MNSKRTVLKAFNFVIILTLLIVYASGRILPETIYYVIASWQIGSWAASILKWLNKKVDEQFLEDNEQGSNMPGHRNPPPPPKENNND